MIRALLLPGLLLAGCTLEPLSTLEEAPSFLEIRLVLDEAVPGGSTAEFEGRMLALALDPVVSDDDVESVRAAERDEGLLLEIRLSPEAGERLREVTGANLGRRMALLVEGDVVSAPVIRSAIGGTPVVASLAVPPEEARRVADAVRSRWPTPPEGDA